MRHKQIRHKTKELDRKDREIKKANFCDVIYVQYVLKISLRLKTY